MKGLARLRVPLGFAAAAIGFIFARPSAASWAAGIVVAGAGEAVRVWAAGHLEKGREVTRSGPYRFVRHPLYLGSALLATGFAIAARNPWVALLAAAYLGTAVLAAIRMEEVEMTRAFDDAYTDYRTGHSAPVVRPFSWGRMAANREYRALLGLAAAFTILALKI
jgi:protein-S-isoprenylcysteine O-methyltransferase Ste14